MRLDERTIAERIMQSRSQSPDEATTGDQSEWPPAAKRILEARMRAGLSEGEMAHRLDMTFESYCDVEQFDDEAFTVLSLAELVTLGEIVGVEPRVLLLGDDGAAVQTTVTFAEIAARLRERALADRISVAQLAEVVGWDIAPVLTDPEALWMFNVEGLFEICGAIQSDWVAALPLTGRR